MFLQSHIPAKLGIIFVNFFGGMDLMDHFRGVPVPINSYKKPQCQRNDSASDPHATLVYYN